MTLAPGAHLGPYEVVAKLGEGGMGEVYRARDRRLDRDVALKILPASFANDADRLMRFEREAKTLASLNHPHIAQIYGLEQSATASAIVMELVDGEDLAARIARGPVALDDAFPLARQMAVALEAAHEAGIIHRDLKPANIKVRPDGTVKVLDFGLARAEAAGRSIDATVTSPAMTMQGVILGTAAYMSPEQAKGKPIDRRVDVWAFGCVLYEMLTGQRAFAGEDVTDTIVAVVSKEPDWSRLPASTPPSVRLLLQRCLEKDQNKRLPHIGVARLELDGSPATMATSTLTPRSAGARRVWMLAAVPIALAMGVAAGLWGAPRAPAPAPAPTYRATLLIPRDGSLMQVAPTGRFAISPDGTLLVYAATGDGVNKLWLRSLQELTARPIADLRGAGAGAPFWSPDSKRIAFFSDGRLMKVDASGATPTLIAESPGFRLQQPGTWNSDDVIVVPHGGTLARVSASGGHVQQLTTLDKAAGESFHTFPHFLPDGQHLLYTAYNATTPLAVYATTLDRPSERQKIMDGGSNVQYADNALLYMRGTTLVSQPFDVASRTLSSGFSSIVDNVLVNIAIHFRRCVLSGADVDTRASGRCCGAGPGRAEHDTVSLADTDWTGSDTHRRVGNLPAPIDLARRPARAHHQARRAGTQRRVDDRPRARRAHACHAGP